MTIRGGDVIGVYVDLELIGWSLLLQLVAGIGRSCWPYFGDKDGCQRSRVNGERKGSTATIVSSFNRPLFSFSPEEGWTSWFGVGLGRRTAFYFFI